MDRPLSPSIWYAVLFAGLVAFLVLCFSIRLALRWLAAPVTDAILRYLEYSTTSVFGLSSWRVSAKDVLFAVLYVSANGVCMGWGVNAAEELSRRSASMLATNLILLLPGASIAADILCISLGTYHQTHSIVGLVALIEGSIHAGHELTARRWTGDVNTISGTAVRVNILLVYRNLSMSKPSTRIQVESVHNSLQVKVRLPRPWKVRPGQYVYLTMMRPGFFSILQRHPFMVAGSEAQDHDFQLRIQPRAGFTSRLWTRTLGGTREFSAFVEGPYGHGFDLQNFGTVVLFASGIGIVGHLAYIQKLVLDYRQSKTKTRDLLVVWHVDNKYQLDLVWEVMNDVLRRDDLPATAMRRDARAPYGSGKMDRHLGSSSSSTSESPGLRPAPHGENASVAAWRPNATKR
ncbi:unnamed protein product [Alternaria alternata]